MFGIGWTEAQQRKNKQQTYTKSSRYRHSRYICWACRQLMPNRKPHIQTISTLYAITWTNAPAPFSVHLYSQTHSQFVRHLSTSAGDCVCVFGSIFLLSFSHSRATTFLPFIIASVDAVLSLPSFFFSLSIILFRRFGFTFTWCFCFSYACINNSLTFILFIHS